MQAVFVTVQGWRHDVTLFCWSLGIPTLLQTEAGHNGLNLIRLHPSNMVVNVTGIWEKTMPVKR